MKPEPILAFALIVMVFGIAADAVRYNLFMDRCLETSNLFHCEREWDRVKTKAELVPHPAADNLINN